MHCTECEAVELLQDAFEWEVGFIFRQLKLQLTTELPPLLVQITFKSRKRSSKTKMWKGFAFCDRNFSTLQLCFILWLGSGCYSGSGSAPMWQQCLCKLQLSSGIRKPGSSSSHRLKRQSAAEAAETAESTYFLCCCSRILFLLLLQSDSKLLLLFRLFPLLLHRFLSKLTAVKVPHEKGSSDLNSSEASKLPISHNSMIESK